MHPENISSCFFLWQLEDNLAVKSARAQQSGIQYIGTVGRGEHDYCFVGTKTIHFR